MDITIPGEAWDGDIPVKAAMDITIPGGAWDGDIPVKAAMDITIPGKHGMVISRSKIGSTERVKQL